MSSIYDIDYTASGLPNTLLPVRRRQPMIVAFLVGLVSPVAYVQGLLQAFRTQTLYVLSHGPQVCHIQGALNDVFDNTERRIYISDGPNNLPNYWYQDDELKPDYLAQDSEVGSTDYASPEYWYTDGETDAGGANFIVNVPTVVAGEAGYDVNYLIAIVNSLKLPNKSFTVVEF